MSSLVRRLQLLAAVAITLSCGSAAATPQATMNRERTPLPKTGGRLSEATALPRRRLEDSCSDTEERRYIDSAITHLDDPIGGCYEVLTTSSNGFSAYALGGAGLVKGTPWLHVTVEGIWEIAMIIGLDADTGYVSQMDTICSATDYQADQLTGPTDPFLDGSWTCSYFQDGFTNYEVAADFTKVECGCSGDHSDGGGVSSEAIAISVLSCVAVLLVLVCVFFFRTRRRRLHGRQEKVDIAPEDGGVEEGVQDGMKGGVDGGMDGAANGETKGEIEGAKDVEGAKVVEGGAPMDSKDEVDAPAM